MYPNDRSASMRNQVPGEPAPGNAPHERPPVALPERLTIRLDEVARSLGISRRALERERSAGRFPRPDLTIGRMPMWRPQTVRAWVEGGGR